MVKYALAQAARPLATLCNASAARSSRQFGSTASLALRATFLETENAPLNKLLTTIQDKIVLPAYLPDKQRRDIFNPKKKHHIQQNPIVLELDGLEHKFKFIDRFKEVPNSKKSFSYALTLMETKDDFDNLPILLGGYQKAGIVLKPNQYTTVITRAANRGQIAAVVECLKQAPKTGFELEFDAHIIQILMAVCKSQRPSVAVKLNDVLLDLLHRSEHQAAKDLHPFSTGMVLYAQAKLVEVKKAQQDVSSETAQLAETAQSLSRWWKKRAEGDLLPESIPALESPLKLSEANPTLSGFALIEVAAYNIKAMELTRQLLPDDAAARDLEAVEKKLDTYIAEYVQRLIKEKRYQDRWVYAYEEPLRRMPVWASGALAHEK